MIAGIIIFTLQSQGLFMRELYASLHRFVYLML